MEQVMDIIQAITCKCNITPGKDIVFNGFENSTSFQLRFLARMEVDSALAWQILWNDEAHFYLNSEIDTHNCRLWSEANSHMCPHTLLYSQKVTFKSGFNA